MNSCHGVRFEVVLILSRRRCRVMPRKNCNSQDASLPVSVISASSPLAGTANSSDVASSISPTMVS